MKVLLDGAWKGDVTDPGRTFVGTLRTGGLPGTAEGHAVQVVFQSAPERVQKPGQHGQYLLSCGERRWALSHFARSDVSDPGTRDEGRPQAWVAEVLDASS
ncbi:hypothetical protein [Deinococcus sonorensis]|uniref:Uncharacterized protein n=2 Tax=Deinococcus sonorensis TaxID=309891 RepID=A0AAU7UAC3_9DEIO